MKRTYGVSIFAATVLTAAVSISLVACGDDSSSANDNPSNNDAPTAQLPDIPCADTLLIDGHYFEGTNVFYKCEDGKWSYVEEKDIPSGIEVPNFFTEYQKAIWKLNKCTADNEGAVQSEWEGNPKYGAMCYYRCEGGSWVQGDITLTCDTVGAPIGAFCRRSSSVNLFSAGMGSFGSTTTYTYAGDGVWETLTGSIELDEECVKDSVGKKKISSYGDKRENTYYLECTEDGWEFIDEGKYHCGVENAVSGDLCSFSVYGDSVYYIYYPVYSDAEDSVTIYGWEGCNYNAAIGCCPDGIFPHGYNPEIGFHELDGKSYYCNAGEWISTTIVPHQYTDSRAEGMTLAEYDVLDLPKEASVGDRAAGLLESCLYDVVLDDAEGPKQGTFNYCVPRAYYRYREDGSWTMETIEEANEKQVDVDDTPCGPSTWCCAETEGLKSVSYMGGDEPDRVYQCVSGKIELVDYVLGRYEEVK